MKFPIVETQDLNKRSYTLPHDLAGEFNLLMLGYAQWQQQQYETWLPFAARLEEAYPAFRYYEVPVAGGLNAVSRFFIDEGMRSAIAGQNTRARVLTLYTDRERLNRALDIRSEEDITLLLVRRDGTIIWRTSGSWSPGKADALDDTLLACTCLAEPDEDLSLAWSAYRAHGHAPAGVQ